MAVIKGNFYRFQQVIHAELRLQLVFYATIGVLRSSEICCIYDSPLNFILSFITSDHLFEHEYIYPVMLPDKTTGNKHCKYDQFFKNIFFPILNNNGKKNVTICLGLSCIHTNLNNHGILTFFVIFIYQESAYTYRHVAEINMVLFMLFLFIIKCLDSINMR